MSDSRGADLLPMGKRLRVFHPERLELATIERLRRQKLAILRGTRSRKASRRDCGAALLA